MSRSLTILGALACLAFVPGDPGALAPGPAELAQARAMTAASVRRSRAIQTAVARAHNLWGDRRAARQGGCKDAAVAHVPARSAVLVPALRDAVQSAQASARRLRLVASSPSVSPLLGEPERADIARALEEVADLRAQYVEIAAWHNRYLRRAAGCAPLEPGMPGLHSAAPVSPEQPVAVILPAAGVACPGDQPAPNRVAVVIGPACYGERGCDCTPVPVAPGAVLPR